MLYSRKLDWAGRAAGLAALIAVLGGCAPLALTAAGIGGSTGVSHVLGGMTYRTFTEPLPKVKGATITALSRMEIKAGPASKIEGGEMIKAEASGREIEIEFEQLSPKTTRMRAVAKKGLLYDSATATEIIIQTENILGQS
ncbi:MAG TPA: hypothetical protein VLC55_04235 [Burkholderiales bacterium]|nr:hypothetical protein [Burkholderiales bacterium]